MWSWLTINKIGAKKLLMVSKMLWTIKLARYKTVQFGNHSVIKCYEIFKFELKITGICGEKSSWRISRIAVASWVWVLPNWPSSYPRLGTNGNSWDRSESRRIWDQSTLTLSRVKGLGAVTECANAVHSWRKIRSVSNTTLWGLIV